MLSRDIAKLVNRIILDNCGLDIITDNCGSESLFNIGAITNTQSMLSILLLIRSEFQITVDGIYSLDPTEITFNMLVQYIIKEIDKK
jgi:hypothetical protein